MIIYDGHGCGKLLIKLNGRLIFQQKVSTKKWFGLLDHNRLYSKECIKAAVNRNVDSSNESGSVRTKPNQCADQLIWLAKAGERRLVYC